VDIPESFLLFIVLLGGPFEYGDGRNFKVLGECYTCKNHVIPSVGGAPPTMRPYGCTQDDINIAVPRVTAEITL
jgi:hypothetical protein